MPEIEPYWIFWGVCAFVGLGFASVWTVTLLDIRDLLRDILRKRGPF